MRRVEWYTDFVDTSYRPKKTDLVALFRFEPATGISVKEAAGRIASESSAGTWTTLHKLPSRIGKIMRALGVDQFHVGTIVGKLVEGKHEIEDIEKEITSKILRGEKTKESVHSLKQNWGRIKPVLPVSYGGVHPGLVPTILNFLGNDICLLVSGGVHGRPGGVRAGARAAMQAIEASMKNISLMEYAKTHVELKQALNKWDS